MDSFSALCWQWEMGATDLVGAAPKDWLRKNRAPAAVPSAQAAAPSAIQYDAPVSPARGGPTYAEASAGGPDLSAVKTLDDLSAAIAAFDGFEIKKSATHMVFGEGAAQPRVVFVGEAPGADEDRLGRPFVGVSGQLLDKMLASIDLSRAENSYITNVIHWRPPGNRAPTPQEIHMSLPFVRKHIALLQPEFMVVLGGSAAKAMLDIGEGITRARGGWRDYACDSGKLIPALIMFHPAYLLRAPAQKALAWRDLLALKAKLG